MFLNVRGSDGGAASVADLLQATSEGARGDSLADTPLTAADVLMLTGTVRFNLEDHDRSLEDLEKALELLAPHRARSEEHTSELQSLMRISYAVFCLTKKKTKHERST